MRHNSKEYDRKQYEKMKSDPEKYEKHLQVCRDYYWRVTRKKLGIKKKCNIQNKKTRQGIKRKVVKAENKNEFISDVVNEWSYNKNKLN